MSDGPPAAEGGPVEGQEDSVPRVDQAVVRELDKIANPRTSWTANLAVLLLTLLIFMGLGMQEAPFTFVVVLIVALFVHEMGHFAAMKLLGYSNVRVFFIPLFGAAVAGENVRAPGWKRALVCLAGPLAGLAGAMCLFVLWFHVDMEAISTAAKVFAILNAFNLLPLYPLDGGRFLQETLFSRNPYVEAVFRVLMAGLTVLAGILLSTWVLPLIGVFVLLRTGWSFKIGTVAAALRRRPGFPDAVDPRGVDPRVLAETHEALKARFRGTAPATVEARRIWDVWEKVNARPPGALATAGLTALYLMVFPAIPVFYLAVPVLLASGRTVRIVEPDGRASVKWEVKAGRFVMHEAELNGSGLYHGTGRSYSYGRPVEKTSWRDGLPHGEWTRYDESGAPAVTLVFEGGKFAARRDHKPDGVVERRREDLPPSYRILLDTAESRGPYGPKNRFAISRALLYEMP